MPWSRLQATERAQRAWPYTAGHHHCIDPGGIGDNVIDRGKAMQWIYSQDNLSVAAACQKGEESYIIYCDKDPAM